MCSVDKMLIKGIRSFSPDNDHAIIFPKPLTLCHLAGVALVFSGVLAYRRCLFIYFPVFVLLTSKPFRYLFFDFSFLSFLFYFFCITTNSVPLPQSLPVSVCKPFRLPLHPLLPIVSVIVASSTALASDLLSPPQPAGAAGQGVGAGRGQGRGGRRGGCRG